MSDIASIAQQVASNARAHLTVAGELRRKPRPTAAGQPIPVEIREARLDDVESICEIVNYWTARGENLPRPRDEIVRDIQQFGVAVADGKVVGCGSLLVYAPTLAEIRSLGMTPEYHGGGAGSRLVRFFLDKAAALHVPRVFVLTRAPGFFEKLGFGVVAIDSLPEKVFKDCRLCPRRTCCDEIAMVHHVPVEAMCQA